METKKIIVRGLFFMTVVAAVYFSVMLACTKISIKGIPLIYRISDGINWKGGNSYKKFVDFKSSNPYDVIVIGSSHAYRGYDPRIFEANQSDLFNLGTSGQSMLNSYFIAKNYIKSSNCKLVILDIYDGALSSDGMESTADLLQNISSDKTAFEMGFALKNPRVINMLTVRMLTAKTPPMYLDTFYVSKGYSEKFDTLKTINKKDYNPDFKPNDLQVDYFIKTLEYLKENKIKTLIVTHPIPQESNNGNHLFFHNVLDSISKMYGVEYLDYAFLHNFNTKLDFYDSHHLNQSGVNKFNDMLIADLRKKGYKCFKE